MTNLAGDLRDFKYNCFIYTQKSRDKDAAITTIAEYFRWPLSTTFNSIYSRRRRERFAAVNFPRNKQLKKASALRVKWEEINGEEGEIRWTVSKRH